MTTNQTHSPPLHLAIDANEANVPNRVGSNVYAFEIIRHLELLLRDYAQIKTTVLLAQPPLPDLPGSYLALCTLFLRLIQYCF